MAAGLPHNWSGCRRRWPGAWKLEIDQGSVILGRDAIVPGGVGLRVVSTAGHWGHTPEDNSELDHVSYHTGVLGLPKYSFFLILESPVIFQARDVGYRNGILTGIKSHQRMIRLHMYLWPHGKFVSVVNLKREGIKQTSVSSVV